MHTYKYHLRYENSSRWTLNCLEIQNLSVALLCHQPVRGGPGVCSMRLRHSEKNALVSTVSGGGAEKDHSPSVRQVLPLGRSWSETGGCYPSWQQLRTGLFVGSFERQVWKEEQRSTAKRTRVSGDKHRAGWHTQSHAVQDERNQNSNPDPFCHQVFSTC